MRSADGRFHDHDRLLRSDSIADLPMTYLEVVEPSTEIRCALVCR